MKVKAAQLSLTLWDPMDYIVHRILLARILEWVAFPFSRGPNPGSNPGFPHCGLILYQLSHKGSPKILEWVAYPFSRGSSQPRNRTRVSCIAGEFFTNWVMREAFITYLFPVINCSTLEGTDFLYVWEMISGVWIWTHVLNYPNRSKSWQMRLQQKNICGVRNKIVDYSHFYNNYFYLIYLSKYQVHLCTLVLCNSYAFWASI